MSDAFAKRVGWLARKVKTLEHIVLWKLKVSWSNMIKKDLYWNNTPKKKMFIIFT